MPRHKAVAKRRVVREFHNVHIRIAGVIAKQTIFVVGNDKILHLPERIAAHDSLSFIQIASISATTSICLAFLK